MSYDPLDAPQRISSDDNGSLFAKRVMHDVISEIGGPREQPSSIFDEDDDQDLVKAFRVFHRQNPAVYRLFNRFAREAVDSGRPYFGVAMIWERMRWYTLVETVGDPIKLNNNHRAYYARLWMHENPQHAGFFRTRRVRDELAP